MIMRSIVLLCSSPDFYLLRPPSNRVEGCLFYIFAVNERMSREYCQKCGEILLKETSLYFPTRINILCYSCPEWYDSIECKDAEDAKLKCAQYWSLVHKSGQVTSAQQKKKRRRRRPSERIPAKTLTAEGSSEEIL